MHTKMPSLPRLFVCGVALALVVCAAQCRAQVDDFADEFEDDVDAAPSHVTSAPAAAQTAKDAHANAGVPAAKVLDFDEDEFEVVEESAHGDARDGKARPAPRADPVQSPRPPASLAGDFDTLSLDKYAVELLALAGIALYGLNYLRGRSHNSAVANAWLDANRQVIEANFALIGEGSAPPGTGTFVRESPSDFILWATGRVYCESMEATLSFVRRHDLVSLFMGRLQAAQKDVLSYTVALDAMDSFVFAVVPKKKAAKWKQEYVDLFYLANSYAGERFELPPQCAVLADSADVVSAIVDSGVAKVIRDNADLFESLHVTDQFAGKIDPNGAPPTKLEGSRRIFLTVNIPSKRDMERAVTFTRLVIHLIDRVGRFELSPALRDETKRKRAAVVDLLLKQTHVQRQEAAQQRKEEKRRKEREAADSLDPEARRRWEEKEHKRELKKKQRGAKQMMVMGR